VAPINRPSKDEAQIAKTPTPIKVLSAKADTHAAEAAQASAAAAKAVPVSAEKGWPARTKVVTKADAVAKAPTGPPRTAQKGGPDKSSAENARKANGEIYWGDFPPSVFLGNWEDSMGHKIAVVEQQDKIMATLTKEGSAPKVIEIYSRPLFPFGPNDWNWICGNGMLDWQWSKKSKEKEIFWLTRNCRASKWERCSP
jgi:hypothetical protein